MTPYYDALGNYLCTVVSSREIFGPREGTHTVERFNREYKRSWVIELLSTDSVAGPETIYQLPGYPKFCDQYQAASGAIDAGSYCKSLNARQLEAPWIWQLEANYSGDVDLRNPTGDPLLMPTMYKWGSKTVNEAVEFGYTPVSNAPQVAAAEAEVATAQAAVFADQKAITTAEAQGADATTMELLYNQLYADEARLVSAQDALTAAQNLPASSFVLKPLLNSAGDPYDPPLVEEVSWLTLDLTKNFAVYNPLASLLYFNAVNNDVWLGFQPGQVLCTKLGADQVFEQGQIYWRVSGTFEIKQGDDPALKGADAWFSRVLDKGWQQLCPATGLPVPIFDKFTGKPKSVVSLLDGAGYALAKGSKPVFNLFFTKRTAAFAGLNLP